MDLSKIKDMLKGLVKDSTSTEDVEQIGAIVQELDNSEKEYTDLVIAHEDLRKKYINAIKDTSFKEKPKSEDPKPISLEEAIQAEIEKR